jgi:hypothetical protein
VSVKVCYRFQISSVNELFCYRKMDPVEMHMDGDVTEEQQSSVTISSGKCLAVTILTVNLIQQLCA